MLVNTTTGDLIGYSGRVKLGERLVMSASPERAPEAVAMLNGADVSADVFSVANYTMGRVFDASELTTPARMPRLARGANDWVFFLLGRYGGRGLDAFGFGMPDDEMQEGAFDESSYDAALFPAGAKAQLALGWQETEPASFILDIPRRFTIESADAEVSAAAAVEAGLHDSIASLHGAGVRAQVTFSPFTERQRQRDRGRLMVVRIDRERGPAGRNDRVGLGGHFGQPTLGGARFE